MAEESAVKVCVRVRPLIAREESASESSDPVQLYWRADEKSIHQIEDGNGTKSFSFDRVFSANETTNQLYQDFAKPLVVSTVEGYNGTIFAYGQTSSGKTFTMMGSDHNLGVIPLAVEDVFHTIKNYPTKEFLLRVSYMEIYNETVNDLLVDGWKRKPLEVREAINKTIYVADLTEELVTSPAQALAWIRKGEKSRHYEKTKMNQRSSRSHTIFRMILESRERGENSDGAIIVSHLNLVDLAGSERASQTGAEGTRFKEGCNINLSLFTLGQVIKKLAENQKGFTNYRDSKLTRILQNSLGGNAKTVIICTITPVALDETLGTLQFASAAKKMKNDPHVTEVSDDGALLKRYRNEIADLKKRLSEVSCITQTTATEKQFLSQLLQEKDQLQREQQDKIRNLTTLLVTSSTSVAVKRIPKRRVTWGGKMLKLCGPGSSEESLTEHSFVESTSRKRKANCSLLTEIADDEEFDSGWEIPDEPSADMDMRTSTVTIRSFGERLDGRVAELEMHLQTQEQEKQEFVDKLLKCEQKAAELEQQARGEAQQKQEALEKVDMLELKVADLVRLLDQQMEADKQTRKEFAETLQICENLASEKDTMITELDYTKQELSMFVEQTESLERENTVLVQQLKDKNELDEFEALEDEARKEHQDELQNEVSRLKMEHLELQKKYDALCEELQRKTEFVQDLQAMNGKDLVQEVAHLRRSLDDAEGLSRDAKKEWAMLRSRNITLEEMKVTLSAEHEKMDADVTSLRIQLDAEKSRNKKMQTDLQKELNIAFDENSKLNTLLDGKVPRNLIDSVELERTVRDLSKELAASQEAEKTLKAQLDQLGDLPDKVDTLMKKVGELTENLCGVEAERDTLLAEQANSQEVNESLHSSLTVAQESLFKAQEDCRAAEQREQDLSQQYTDVAQQLETLNSNLERSDAEKNQHLATIADINLKAAETQDLLQQLQEELDQEKQKIEDMMSLHEKKESDVLCQAAETRDLLQQCQQELDQHKRSIVDMMSLHEKKESDLMGQIECLTEELQKVQSENNGTESSSEEKDQLLSTVAALTEERDQLKMDVQENVEMMIENQGELRMALETISEQKVKLKQLQAALMTQTEGNDAEMSAQKQQLVSQVKALREELDQVQAEKDSLQCEQSSDATREEMVKLMNMVASVTEEKDQLQESLECLRQEKRQLQEELEEAIEKMAMLPTTVQELSEQKSQLETELQNQIEASETQSLFQSVQEQLQEQLQRNTDLEKLAEERRAQCEQQMIQNESQVTLAQEKVRDLEEEINQLRAQKTDLESRLSRDVCPENIDNTTELHQQIQSLSEELKHVRAERNSMQVDGTVEAFREETENLQNRLMSLTEEKDQLLETLEGLKQEKRRLSEELEETMAGNQMEVTEMKTFLQTLTEQKTQLEDNLQKSTSETCRTQDLLKSVQEELLSQKQTSNQQLCSLELQITTLRGKLEVAEAERDRMDKEEMEMLQRRVVAVSEERDQLLETLESLRQEKKQLRDELEETSATLQTEITTLTDKLKVVAEKEDLLLEKEHSCQTLREEAESLQSRLMSLTEERDQLQETLESTGITQKSQINTLTEKLSLMADEKDFLMHEIQSHREETEELQSRLTSLTEEKDHLQNTLDQLRQEKMQLAEEMEEKLHMTSRTQDLLKSVQEELLSQKQTSNQQLCSLELQITTLRGKLEVAEAERDRMDKEEEISEEMEMLQRRVVAVSEERDQLLETLESLRQEKKQLRDELEETSATLQTEITTLTDKLKVVAEKEDLLLEKEHSCQTLREEAESLQSRLMSLTEERDQLQETLESTGITQKSQINTLTEKLSLMADEKDFLMHEIQSHREETEELQSRLTSLTEEKDHLQNTLDQLRQEKMQLAEEMEEKLHMTSRTQDLLKSVQEELLSQKQTSNQQLCSLELQITTLRGKLEVAEAERDRMDKEEEISEEMEMLQRRVVAVSEERDQLLETLESLRQEKKQLRDELEETSATLQTEITTLTDKLKVVAEKEDLLLEKEHSCQTLREEAESLQSRLMSLTEERDQLQETLESTGITQKSQINTLTEKLSLMADEKDFLMHEIQSHREETEELQSRLTSLTEEKDHLQNTLDQLRQEKMQLAEEMEEKLHMSLLEDRTKDAALVRLQDSTEQLQELFAEFQQLLDRCSESSELTKDRKVEWILQPSDFDSLPKSYTKTYCIVTDLGLQSDMNMDMILEHIHLYAKIYRKLLDGLVNIDLAIFEEQRVQDVLMCRAQAQSYSVNNEDFSVVWEQRLTVAVDNRQIYMQKIGNNLKTLWAYMSSYTSQLSAEKDEREKYSKQLKDPGTDRIADPISMEHILNCELKRRSEVTPSIKMMLKSIIDEQTEQRKELGQLTYQRESGLREERSKRVTLQEALGGAELKTELSLLKDNHQLAQLLQDAQGKVEALDKRIEDLKIHTNDRLSTHKQATQLLQTELQDSRALAEEKENVIQTLKSKLRESEKNASPSAVELTDLREKVFKLELEMSVASDKHQQEVQRMTTVLTTKEQSMRKLKETIRQSHQQDEDTFHQGKDLHARLVDPRGAVITSSVHTEKVKLEEEVKQLKCQITELKSLLSDHNAEMTKWKTRACKLKSKTKLDVSPSPGLLTPTKRNLPFSSDLLLNSPKKFQLTPKRVLESPKKPMNSPRATLNSSPKSRFFDVAGTSELLSKSYPKQFFDNSGLGNIPGISAILDTADSESDVGVKADKLEEYWPQSPKQEDMCKTQ